MNDFILFINFLLYAITSYLSWKKNGYNLSTLLWVYHSFFALIGFIIVKDGLYFQQVNTANKELTIIPYILNYICVYMLVTPLEKIKLNSLTIINLKINKFIRNIILLIIILYIAERLYEIVAVANMSFEDRYLLIADEGADLTLGNPIFKWMRVICGFFFMVFMPFIMIWVTTKIIREKRINFHSCVLIVLCFLPFLLTIMGAGNRSELFLLCCRILFYVIIILPFLSKQIKKKILGIIFVSFIGIFALFMSISNSRFSNSDIKVSQSIMRYMGESFPNLGYVYWDRVKKHPMGERKFPYIKKLFSISKTKKLKGHRSAHQYWYAYTGTPVLYFKSAFCDFYIEFGIIGALIIIFIVSLLIKKYLRERTVLNLFDMAIISQYFVLICCHSIFGTYIGNLRYMLIFLVMYIISTKINKRYHHELYNTKHLIQ